MHKHLDLTHSQICVHLSMLFDTTRNNVFNDECLHSKNYSGDGQRDSDSPRNVNFDKL